MRVRKKIAKKPDNLNAQMELFCHYYINCDETRFNGQDSYLAAYDEEGEMDNHVAQQAASRLLRTVKVKARCDALLDALIRDDVVDRRMQQLMLQNRDYPTAIAALREYNRVKQRITAHVDHTTLGQPIPREQTILLGDSIIKEE